MRHDGLDPASSLHHTQGNGEQCVWILRTYQQVNPQDYSSPTESMMGQTIPTWQIYITLWTTWEILKAKDQHQTQQQYNQNVEVSLQCMVLQTWTFNQFQAYFRIYLIVPEVGGKPLDRGKPVNLLRRPCFYLTSFVKALPVIFISRYLRRLVAFIGLVHSPQYCGMVILRILCWGDSQRYGHLPGRAGYLSLSAENQFQP